MIADTWNPNGGYMSHLWQAKPFKTLDVIHVARMNVISLYDTVHACIDIDLKTFYHSTGSIYNAGTVTLYSYALTIASLGYVIYKWSDNAIDAGRLIRHGPRIIIPLIMHYARTCSQLFSQFSLTYRYTCSALCSIVVHVRRVLDILYR